MSNERRKQIGPRENYIHERTLCAKMLWCVEATTEGDKDEEDTKKRKKKGRKRRKGRKGRKKEAQLWLILSEIGRSSLDELLTSYFNKAIIPANMNN